VDGGGGGGSGCMTRGDMTLYFCADCFWAGDAARRANAVQAAGDGGA